MAILALQPKLHDGVKTDMPERTLREATVQFIAERPGHFGGKILRLRKTGARWISSHTTVDYDAQGDPRWFIEAIGREAAEYFGFKMLTDEEMEVPDATEFQTALDQLNSYLREISQPPVAIQFYATQDNENVKVKFYVGQFGHLNGIPLAHSGNHLIHDLSFHTGAIFLPPEILAMKSHTVRYLEAFLEAEEAKYKGDAQKARLIRYYSYMLRMFETISIDRATGLVTTGIIQLLRNHEAGKSDGISSPFSTPVSQLLNSILMEAMPPKKYIKFLIENLHPRSKNFSFLFGSFIDPNKVLETDLIFSLMPEEVGRDFDKFAFNEQMDPKLWEAFADWRSPEFEKWCKWIFERRKTLNAAAVHLLRTRSGTSH